MLEAKKNKIKVTRGDTAPLDINILMDNEPYEPAEGDTCRFAVSVSYLSEDDYELILVKNVSLDSLPSVMPSSTLTSEDTKIPYGTYNYDVQITHVDGTIETFISSTIQITGEVK